MANSDKQILITPNKGSSTDDPTIVFSGADASSGPNNITLKVYPTSSGTMSFEGTAGQLFSITNDLTGVIFSVNDVSGIPSIEVNADGTVKFAEFGGNVGIGVTTPGSKLDVKGTLRLSGATSGYVGIAPAAAAGSVTYTLPSTDGASGTVLSTNGSATLSWLTPATDTINAANDTSTTALYPVMVAAAGSNQTAKVTTTKLYFNAATGELSATSYNSISDARAKLNIRDLDYGLDTVLKLEAKKFEMLDSGITSIGLIAQEVESLVPEVVMQGPKYKSINYGALIAVLIQAVKELNQKIERLEGNERL